MTMVRTFRAKTRWVSRRISPPPRQLVHLSLAAEMNRSPVRRPRSAAELPRRAEAVAERDPGVRPMKPAPDLFHGVLRADGGRDRDLLRPGGGGQHRGREQRPEQDARRRVPRRITVRSSNRALAGTTSGMSPGRAGDGVTHRLPAAAPTLVPKRTVGRVAVLDGPDQRPDVQPRFWPSPKKPVACRPGADQRAASRQGGRPDCHARSFAAGRPAANHAHRRGLGETRRSSRRSPGRPRQSRPCPRVAREKRALLDRSRAGSRPRVPRPGGRGARASSHPSRSGRSG